MVNFYIIFYKDSMIGCDFVSCEPGRVCFRFLWRFKITAVFACMKAKRTRLNGVFTPLSYKFSNLDSGAGIGPTCRF